MIIKIFSYGFVYIVFIAIIIAINFDCNSFTWVQENFMRTKWLYALLVPVIILVFYVNIRNDAKIDKYILLFLNVATMLLGFVNSFPEKIDEEKFIFTRDLASPDWYRYTRLAIMTVPIIGLFISWMAPEESAV